MSNTNEWRLERESVCAPARILDTVQEQSVELDYVLPDYYPDFFRLLSCTAEPTVVSWDIRDGLLQYSCAVRIRVLYVPEQGGTVQAVTQQLDYQKQLNLPADAAVRNLQVRLHPTTSYMNCRAVNHRRMDLRGAIRLDIHLSGEREQQVIADACGLHCQCKKETVNYVSQMLRTSKRCVISEALKLNEAQPALLSILREQIALTVNDTRIVAGKLMVKGEAAVTILYTSASGIETLQSVFPFHQIVEQDGLRDDMPCMVEAELADYLFTTEADGNGDIRLVHCDLQVRLLCEAVCTVSADLVTDLYSTVHPCTLQSETVELLECPVPICEHLQTQFALPHPEQSLARVYAVWVEPCDLHMEEGESGSQLVGSLRCKMMAADMDNAPILIEHTEPVTLPLHDIPGDMRLPRVTVQTCSYTLTDAETVTVQVMLLLKGYGMRMCRRTLLTDAQPDADTRLSLAETYALRLYFGQPQEALWDIARRFHTTVAAIQAENEDCCDPLTQAQMLLIPMVQ